MKPFSSHIQKTRIDGMTTVFKMVGLHVKHVKSLHCTDSFLHILYFHFPHFSKSPHLIYSEALW